MTQAVAPSRTAKTATLPPVRYGQQALGRCLAEFYKQRKSGHEAFECLNKQGQGVEGMYVKPLT
ncbi:hypothetical protein [Streptomyces sp. NPDC059788]|uniref:hypothetical protein n=1 Tax=Streptomyces sp. NPDC059788 TaxID=3346948 RepID=UPI0036556F89